MAVNEELKLVSFDNRVLRIKRQGNVRQYFYNVDKIIVES